MNASYYLCILIPLFCLAVDYQRTFSISYSLDCSTKFSLLSLSASLGGTNPDPDEDGPPDFKPPPPPGNKGHKSSGSNGPTHPPKKPPVPSPRTRPGTNGPNHDKGKPRPPVPLPRTKLGTSSPNHDKGKPRPPVPAPRKGKKVGENGGKKPDCQTEGRKDQGEDNGQGSGGGGCPRLFTVQKPSKDPPRPPPRSSSLPIQSD
ncbi:hypothetical protein CmeUKMEL1_09040 [Cryptosporidium meleagridis]|uniref:Integral membrane protein n=1 Tax=Cryptosporidium meleagridis TaxID=93969 RepID=A0A2P4Z115_9CRYT|nr:hypothetical protein CmeUKMEL1_09040 [Cryptosporidium meleagridis]